jgi:uncharacterized protein YceK
MRPILSSAAVAFFAIALSGCGTMCNFAGAVIPGVNENGKLPAVYGGVQLDAAMVTGLRPAKTTEWNVFVACCVLADFPLSLVGDTLTLPITIGIDRVRNPAPREQPVALTVDRAQIPNSAQAVER